MSHAALTPWCGIKSDCICMHVHTPSSHDHTSLYVHIISAAVHIMSHMQWCNVMWSHLWPQHISIRFCHFLLFARLPVTLRTLFTYILEADGAEITAHLRLLHDCFMSKFRMQAAHVIAPQAHVWERGRGEGHGSVYLASQGAPARSCGLGAGSGCTMSHEVFYFSSRRDPAAGERSGA